MEGHKELLVGLFIGSIMIVYALLVLIPIWQDERRRARKKARKKEKKRLKTLAAG